MEPFTLTLVLQSLDLDPVCRSQLLSACLCVPQKPHLQTTLKQIKRNATGSINLIKGPWNKLSYFTIAKPETYHAPKMMFVIVNMLIKYEV